MLTVGMLGLAFAEFARGQMEEESAGGAERRGGSRLLTVNVEEVTPSKTQPVLATFGEVQSARVLELRSPESGQVMYLAPDFRDGTVYEEGTLMARLDPATFQAAVDIGRSDVEIAKDNVTDAARNVELAERELVASREQRDLRAASLQRQMSLSDRGVGTDAALEDAELALSSAEQALITKEQALATAEINLKRARAEVIRAEVNLSEAERALRNTEVYAPFRGALADVDVAVGVFVSPNEAVGSFVDQSSLEVSVLLSLEQFTSIIGRVDDVTDLSMEVSLTEGGPNFSAKVLRTEATVADGQTGRRLYASLDPEAAKIIKPGDFVSVRLIEPEVSNVAWVPAGAVGSGSRGLVIENKTSLEAVTYEVISRDGERVLISTDGLEGRMIVSQLTPKLNVGQRVQPVLNGTPLDIEEAAASDNASTVPGQRG
ncbi:MAG: HlyD family efflux transporter periplasmic adaptor subunit [Pseudomonadota bacterium]